MAQGEKIIGVAMKDNIFSMFFGLEMLTQPDLDISTMASSFSSCSEHEGPTGPLGTGAGGTMLEPHVFWQRQVFFNYFVVSSGILIVLLYYG